MNPSPGTADDRAPDDRGTRSRGDASPRARVDDVLLRAAIICFAVGLVAIVAFFIAVALGTPPLWLGLPLQVASGTLAPLGFVLGLVYAFRVGTRTEAPDASGQNATE